MAKKKKTPKKRNLKYGKVGAGPVNSKTIVAGSQKESETVAQNVWFRKELRRNLIFIAAFFVVLIIIYVLAARTNILNQVLAIFGLKNLY